MSVSHAFAASLAPLLLPANGGGGDRRVGLLLVVVVVGGAFGSVRACVCLDYAGALAASANEKSAVGGGTSGAHSLKSSPASCVCVCVCLCRRSSSVPETTFDLHGDVHSGAALPTSKVTHARRCYFGVRGQKALNRTPSLIVAVARPPLIHLTHWGSGVAPLSISDGR